MVTNMKLLIPFITLIFSLTFSALATDSKVPNNMVFVDTGVLRQIKKNELGKIDTTETQIPSFWISKYEETQAEYEKIMGNNPSFHKGTNLPVESLNWWEVIKYCNNKSVKEGLKPCYDTTIGSCDYSSNGYRLPTQNEWEFAAKGGILSKGFYGSGGNNAGEIAWYIKNSNARSHEVGLKKPNELGLYDMSGNVWEYCDGIKLHNPHSRPKHYWVFLKGGARNSVKSLLLTSKNLSVSPDVSTAVYGFRLCRSQIK